jgi:hypothetical protein
MKIQLKKCFVGFVLILSGFVMWAQNPNPASIPNPTYTCSIADTKMVSSAAYEFDLIMQRTGKIDIKLSHFQVGILLNPAIVPAGATITVTPVPGSSSLLLSQQPGPDRFSYDSKNNCIRITSVPPNRANGSTTISASEGGTRLIRLRVTCSQPFNTGVSTNHTWNFSFATGYATKVFALVGGPMYVNTDITVQASHKKSTASPSDVTFTK